MTAPGKEPASLTSADPTAERFSAFRALFPDVFVDGEIDFDKLRAALGDSVATGPERFTFSWAGRSDAAALLQTPSRATLIPKPKESVNWDTTRNLFIEGDNLEVLKLLYKAYAGKVKLIYIDPPYNTGQDFVYPDNFADPLAVYLQLTKQVDAAGKLLTSNPETSGRYHSAWLSMMYPRLFLARQLLRDDGVIFISIDDHEVHHLRLLMNEVFGEENFLGCILWRKKYSPANDTIKLTWPLSMITLSYFNALPTSKSPSKNEQYWQNFDELKSKTLLIAIPTMIHEGLGKQVIILVTKQRKNDPICIMQSNNRLLEMMSIRIEHEFGGFLAMSMSNM
jgi:hypothetical protein